MAEQEEEIMWPGGFPEAKSVDDFDFIMSGKNGGPITKIPKSRLAEVVGVVGESMPAIQGGTTAASAVTLPAGPVGQNRWFDASWGYWKYNNVVLKNPLGTDGIPEGNDGQLYWSGTATPPTWSISKMQALPMQQGVPVLNPAGSGLPTEKATAEYSVARASLFPGINTYSYLQDLSTGYYIQSTDGSLTASATSSVSAVYPYKSGKIVHINNRTGASGLRFLDASGNPLPPLDVNGNPFATPYASPYLNGGYKGPAGAIGYQFTTGFTGTTNRQNITVTDTPAPVPNPQVRKELIPDTDKVLQVEAKTDSNTLFINTLNSPPISERINKLENTNTPQMFPAANEVDKAFGISIRNDIDSPVKSKLPYTRVFRTDITANGGTNFRTTSIPVGTSNRPTEIDFSFWTRKDQFQAIFTGSSMATFLSGGAYSILQPQNLLTGVEITATPPTVFPSEYSAAVCKAKVINEVNGWIRIRINYSGIVWETTFTGSTIPYFFLFNGASPNGKDFYFADFTVLFNDRAQGNIIYPSSSDDISSNVYSLEGMQNDISKLQDQISSSGNGPVAVKFTGSNLYIGTNWDASNYFVKSCAYERELSFTSNPNFNLSNVYLSLKALKDISIRSKQIKTTGDDICPVQINGGYVGGNHSWSWAKEITLTNHGKTLKDVGSVYKDTNNVEFVIMRIVDSSKIWVCSKNQATNGYSYTYIKPVGDLIYVRNGDNTSTITGYSQDDLRNMYPSLTKSSRKLLLDGVTVVTQVGDYSANFVDVQESYNIIDLTSIVNSIELSRPSSGYTTQPYFSTLPNVEVVGTHNLLYRFDRSGNTVVYTTFVAIKKLDFNFHGFIQAEALNSGSLYIPKALPYTLGSKTYDFRKIENWTTNPTDVLHLTPEYWEKPLSPPDRLVNMNSDVVIALGYIPDKGKALNRKDNVIDAIFLSSIRKLYPKGDSITRVMNEFDTTSIVSYRSFNNPNYNPAGRTNFNFQKDGESITIWLDYHGSLKDSVVALSEWAGMNISVVEKTDNVNLISDIVTNTIDIVSTATASSYGYIVLKLV
ncbi:hypothetical protein BN1088_1433009 [Sphingobacterium sp. PM2-P1-29]|nr:hypothetical protein BN1088_1433009 [Sphingobacterium sp. PM2-P1-29]